MGVCMSNFYPLKNEYPDLAILAHLVECYDAPVFAFSLAKMRTFCGFRVKAHIERVYYKLKVKNRVQASVLGFLNCYKDMGLIIKQNFDPSIVEE
jgi:hypothetical protein